MGEKNTKKVKFNLDEKKVLFENSFITSQIYKKIIIYNTAIMIISMITILCSFSIFDISQFIKDFSIDPNIKKEKMFQKNIMLFFSSCCAVTLSILEIISKKNELEYNIYRGENIKINRFWSLQNLKSIMINILFYMMHPNIIFEYVTIANNNQIHFTYDDFEVFYTFNDIMLLLNLLNIIPFFNSMLRYVTYNSDVADRVWQFNKSNKWFYQRLNVWHQMFIQEIPHKSFACCFHDQHVYICNWSANLRILSKFVNQKGILRVEILFIISILFGLWEQQ